MSTPDILSISRGSIVAPAGCGKTESIVQAVARNNDKPALVLTHTNAGVCALRSRMTRAKVAGTRARVTTLDGWCLQVVSSYPELSGLRPDLSAIQYPALREAATRAVSSGALDAILRASYSRVIVDEYQDCTHGQHRLVVALAERLPCCVLGDPLQRIFDFAGPLPDWDTEVLTTFPLVATLDEPWRWIRKGEEDFGRWILSIRDGLERGEGVDLMTAPANVIWKQAVDQPQRDGAEADAMAMLKGMMPPSALVVGSATDPASRVAFAKAHGGVQVVERADMPEVRDAAHDIGNKKDRERLNAVLKFAQSAMSHIDNDLVDRLNQITAGTVAPESDTDRAFVAARQNVTFANLARLLESWSEDPDRNVFRPDLLNVMVDGLRRANEDGELKTAVLEVREAKRSKGRDVPALGIGSTLLLKGLEAERVLILDAGSMNACNAYVALSRASKSVMVISDKSVIGRHI
ncbi:UvrD-helicase domain-containing protein [uncultured Sphingomonas sp.]|uniref:UvrD-helicase domain-containing protein n=1 Tax=uncultured Sphingomonas sp. TaxID=158754 RepID=UPI0025F7E6A8|nr:UvrD-helicase domain-containing protein [uncultured Sphingomonas sp.]